MPICDYTNNSGKKDVTYNAGMFQKKVNQFDPEGGHIDVFFFDRASNVQKAGQILCQNFPRAYCL